MIFACSRSSAARTLLLAGALMLSAVIDDAFAQSRRRSQEPAPPPPSSEPLPEIRGETTKCSFAFHDAVLRIGNGTAKPLATFDALARVAEPGLTGRWLFWIKSGKNLKSPTTEQVCIEKSTRGGRDRCLRWETRRMDAAVVGAQPTSDELTVLRALDGFVNDKGAPLEFGSNGRQFATLQRVAGELGSYTAQPRHPALCNGAQEMMDFHAGNLAGVTKRGDDVAATAAKAIGFARKRVSIAREQRMAEAKAANAVAAAAAIVVAPVGSGDNAPARPPGPAAAIVAVPNLVPIPATSDAKQLVSLALEGLVSAEQQIALDGEPSVFRRLQRAREMVAADALPTVTSASRATVGGALRMIEAAAYGELQLARMKPFQDMFLGTVGQIREAHRTHCTCGS